MVVAVNEQGVVVSHRASHDFVNKWLAGDVNVTLKEDWKPAASKLPDIHAQYDPTDLEGLNKIIASFEETRATSEKFPALHFELGVFYRSRFELTGDVKDFQNSIDSWTTAREQNPNQYIYRRRIEQYGARLEKPYPFYDWVDQAITEIRERGEQPVELKVPIGGAEIAGRARQFQANDWSIDWEKAVEINADEADLLQIQAVAVPTKVRPGTSTRIHVLALPGEDAKWNNETEPATFVLKPNDQVELSDPRAVHEQPKEAETTETRQFEFEVLLKKGATEPVTVEGAVLTNICIDSSGVCTYLRKPFKVTIEPN